jgi:hypothetical protein
VIKRAFTILVTAAAIATASAGTAAARPVADTPVYCGPGMTNTVYDVRTGGTKTKCTKDLSHNRLLITCRWFDVMCRIKH